jgi:hypothetical protein
MNGGALCSFSTASAFDRSDPTMASVVRVMLGVSEAHSDVRAALADGPSEFFLLLATTDFASCIAETIVQRASGGYSSLPVGHGDVTELIRHYLESRFFESSTTRIGARGVYNFQRLVYNVCAGVVARLPLSPEFAAAERIATLRRATAIVAEFAEAVKCWLPVSPWVGKWWTRWHVLCYVLEITHGTELSTEKPNSPHPMAFLIFCDEIVKHVLLEWDTSAPMAQSLTDYRSNSFAWCACSKAWHRVLSSCCDQSNAIKLPNAMAFVSATSNAFAVSCAPPTSPLRADVQSRPSSPHDAKTSAGKRRLAYASPGSDDGARRVAARIDPRAPVPRLALS